MLLICKNIFILFIIFNAIILSSCDKFNPLAPDSESNQEPLPWQSAELPQTVIGEWYYLDKINITIVEDTVKAKHKYFDANYHILDVEKKEDQHYRLILEMVERNSTYAYLDILFLSETELEIAFSKEYAMREEYVRNEPPDKSYVVAKNPTWITLRFPDELIGNWQLQQGDLDVEIEKSEVFIYGKSWSIEAVETNKTIERLVLKNGQNIKSLYFSQLVSDQMQAVIKDGRVVSFEEYQKLLGELRTYTRWWNLFDYLILEQGSLWRYGYEYNYSTNYMLDDGVFYRHGEENCKRNGTFEFEIVQNEMLQSSRKYQILASYNIEKEEYKYYFYEDYRDIADRERTVIDTSYTKENFEIFEEFSLVLDNDTLWYETEQGKEYFINVRLEKSNPVNLKLFGIPTLCILNMGNQGPDLSFFEHTETNVELSPEAGFKNVDYSYVRDYTVSTQPSLTKKNISFILIEFIPGKL